MLFGPRPAVFIGSVVTRSLPEHVLADDNPCRVVREIESSKAVVDESQIGNEKS
jgi:acetyltransferase-like isoleucine patch superfamily enzyme